MNLLSILDFGIGGLALLTLFFLGLAGVFLYKAIKASKSGSEQQLPGGGVALGGNIPIYKINWFWGAVGMVLAYGAVLLFIKSDYRDYNPKKDGVPQEQTDTTRSSAEDQLSKDSSK